MSNDTKLLTAQARINELRTVLRAMCDIAWQVSAGTDYMPLANRAKKLLAVQDDTAELDALIADAKRR